MDTPLLGMATTKAICVLYATLAVGCAVGAAQTTGRTVRHYKVPDGPATPPELTQAEAAIEKKDYGAAEPLLQKVVAADPGNYEAWFDLGFVDNAQGKSQEAIDAYKKSVAAKPDVFESNLNLGLILAKTGQPGAEQYLRAATTLTPTANVEEGHARAWLSLAHVVEGSDPTGAITAYQRAAELRPNDPEPHLAAGQLLEKQNRFADAEQEYKKALAIDPESADAITGLANVAMRGQRIADAEELLRKLVALHPDDAAAHRQLGRVLMAAGHNDDALQELQGAVKIDPSDLSTHRDLADLYMTEKKYDLAAAQYQALLAANPRDPELHHALGTAWLKQNKYPQAEQEFLMAVKLKPDFGAAYGDLAVAADSNKDYELAIRATDARAKFLPEIPVGYFLRATAYDHLRD